MREIKTENTIIKLIDNSKNKGTIIIEDIVRGNYSYTWCAMGCNIDEFILSISPDYFANKLCLNNYVFSAKKSISNVRDFIRNDLKYDIPWYKYMGCQKILREYLKEVENSIDEQQFVEMMENIVVNIEYNEKNYDIDKDFLKHINCLSIEPWNFIIKEDSNEFIWLKKLFFKIKKNIKNNLYI